jgi:hypothetical protein
MPTHSQGSSRSAFNTPNAREPRRGTPWTVDLSGGIAERISSCGVHPTGNLEWLPVLRRLTAFVIIWVSLLGAAFPAFACSLAASQSGCCGEAGTPSPCSGGERFVPPLDVTPAICCASGHTAVPSMAVDSGRTSHEPGHSPTSPDQFVLIAWSTSWLTPVRTSLNTAPLTPSPLSTAALTYLHTARLRL